jgi:hypothetical protein
MSLPPASNRDRAEFPGLAGLNPRIKRLSGVSSPEFIGVHSAARNSWDRPASAPIFIALQFIGGTAGTLLAIANYPVRRGRVRVEEPAQLAG